MRIVSHLTVKLSTCLAASLLALSAARASENPCPPEQPGHVFFTSRGIRVETNGYHRPHPNPNCVIRIADIERAFDTAVTRWASPNPANGQVAYSAGAAAQALTQVRNVIIRREQISTVYGAAAGVTDSRWQGSATNYAAQNRWAESIQIALHVWRSENEYWFPTACGGVLMHELDHHLAWMLVRQNPYDASTLVHRVGHSSDIWGGSQPSGALSNGVPAYGQYCEPPAPVALPYSVDHWGQAGDRALAGRFFSTERDDLVVYRAGAQSVFYVKQSGGPGMMSIEWGQSGDQPFVINRPGQTAKVAVFRPSSGVWYIHGEGSFQFGQNGDVGLVGDFTGQGVDIAVYRPSNHQIYVRVPGGYRAYGWGQDGDQPVVGDFLGRGHDQIAQFRSSNGTWYIIDVSSATPGFAARQFGAPGDIPVPGRYLAGSCTQLAVWRPGNATFYFQDAFANCGNRFQTLQWGQGGDQPLALDRDGDGQQNPTIFRASTSEWWIRDDQ